jgi:hypothetical protein
MRLWTAPAWVLAGILISAHPGPGAQSGAAADPSQAAPAGPTENLFYSAEWRFVRAGEAQVSWMGERQVAMSLKTVGLVNTLFKVSDEYRATYDPGLCATSISFDSHEGRRNREIRVTFDRTRRRASFVEKDLNNNTVVLTKELDVPFCLQDVLGGLHRLRQMHPAVGTTVEFPVSDGKKVIMARIEAQQQEAISTPLGKFNATRYEVFLFNGVLYARKGRIFIWISDDEKHLPVQIKVQLPFYVGTITVQLEKVQ